MTVAMRSCRGTVAASLTVALGLVPLQVGAQAAIARADSLLRVGRVARAEALYYAAARRQPRDPATRFALGQYLASRGALRVGAVLVEEATRFGADPARAAALLAPIYAQLDDYAALVRLGAARLAPGEYARARWLLANPPTFSSPDSVRLPLIPAGRAGTFGSVILLIEGDTLRAEIDPATEGLVLDRRRAGTPGVRAFDRGTAAAQPAVVGRVALGAILMHNVSASLAELGGPGRARIGLDWLARWAPTIDAGRSRTLTLRRAGRVPAPLAAHARSRIPLLSHLPSATGAASHGPWIAVPGGIAKLAGAEVTRLRTARVTLDPRRGELLVD